MPAYDRGRGARTGAAVYVDRLRVHRSRTEPARTAGEQFGHRWCHLWSDDLNALHAMAAALGMRRECFQERPGFPHYDLPPFRRERALALGAAEHSLKDWLRARREAGSGKTSGTDHSRRGDECGVRGQCRSAWTSRMVAMPATMPANCRIVAAGRGCARWSGVRSASAM